MEEIIITSWNVRGANSLVVKQNIRILVRESIENVLLLYAWISSHCPWCKGITSAGIGINLFNMYDTHDY